MQRARTIPVAWLGSGSCKTGLRAEYQKKITKIKEWLCSLRLADMSQSRKSVVRVKDYYIRNTTNFTNPDTLPSWKMCHIIWESILPGILFRHWVHHVWRVMVKVSHDMPVQAQKGGRGIAPTHLQPSTRRWVDSTHSGHLTPGKKTTTHFYRRLRGQSGWHRKILPPLEFNPRTISP